MQDGRTQAEFADEADTERQVTDLGHTGIGQHTLYVVLENRNKGRKENSNRAQHGKTVGERHRLQREAFTKNRKQKPQQRIDRHLRGGSGQKRTHSRGGVGIGIG